MSVAIGIRMCLKDKEGRRVPGAPQHLPVDFVDPSRAEKRALEATGEETTGSECRQKEVRFSGDEADDQVSVWGPLLLFCAV